MTLLAPAIRRTSPKEEMSPMEYKEFIEAAKRGAKEASEGKVVSWEYLVKKFDIHI